MKLKEKIEMEIIFNRFYYNPLPENLYINVSEIDGHGIFAKEVIDFNTYLGETHIKVPLLFNFIRTPLGGFINHSEQSNCYVECTYDWDGYKIFNLVTETKIQKDQELFLNYEGE